MFALVCFSSEGKNFDEQDLRTKFEFFPIVMWDTDIGFGYGVKVFYFNGLKLNESFDVVLFNSTKGEKWYRFVFSLPDPEQRQGRKYPLAFDMVLNYDKWIRNSFFGIGNQSNFEDREYYTREPFEISFILSRGFLAALVGQVGIRYKTIRNFNFEENSLLYHTEPDLNRGRVTFNSFFLNLRYDTRDSYINPSRGIVVMSEFEHAINTGFSNASFGRFSTWLQYYRNIFSPKTVVAMRLGIQTLFGNDLPVQVLLPIGGNRTLRGYPQDRFLDKTSAVFNFELRFPLFWRFGAVAGFDTGKVWSSLSEIDLSGWAINPVIGLRFYLKNFLVRFDVGFGEDSTGIYFNFGHIF